MSGELAQALTPHPSPLITNVERTIRPASVRGRARVPGDKSISHRALLFAALADGTSRLWSVADSADCRATRRVLEALGVRIVEEGPGRLRVDSPGLLELREPPDVLDAANSGTTTRLVAGVLATRPFLSVLTGDASLRRRPMGRVVEPLTAMGATILGRDGNRYLPMALRGGHLRGIDYVMPVASAQVKSAVLLAGLGAEGVTRVREPLPSRDHTERMLESMGVPLARIDEVTVEIDGGTPPRPGELEVPGDVSSAAFFVVAALLARDSAVEVIDVGLNPTRTGALDALRQMGGQVDVSPRPDGKPEPLGSIVARSSQLGGIEIGGRMIPRLLDELPLLALAATQAAGRTIVRDAADLRVKESDRVATTAGELRRLGADIVETPDGFIVQGPTPLRGARCRSHGDHRIAMMLAVAGLIADGETVVEDAACVEVSFPGFFEALSALTVEDR